MVAAFLTTVFFCLSAITANRSVAQLGSNRANFWRLLAAMGFLGAWAFVWGHGVGGAGFGWFLLSGIVGFGIGDIGVFHALPRIGSRLTLLMTQCIAAPLAGMAEWLWMGTRPTALEMLLGALILAGVAIALLPEKAEQLPVAKRRLLIGLFCGLIAAAGQGFGAVLSRKAYLVLAAAGEHTDGGTAAFQRVLGGLVVALFFYVLIKQPAPQLSAPASMRKRVGLVLANALFGAVLGVSCYQLALATVPSAVVLAIVALTPIVAIPLTRWLEGEKPGWRSICGGVIAVLAASCLALMRSR
ncbi:MAG: DMT family transporter [Verrucomicrobiota bacterium]|nr:DMT family transporter [Verrucomicrobiota bacterium]